MHRDTSKHMSVLVLFLALIVGICIYQVRQYLPLVGMILLVCISIGAICGILYLVFRIWHHVYTLLHAPTIHDIGQHGSLEYRHGKTIVHEAYTRHALPKPEKVIVTELPMIEAPKSKIPTMSELLGNRTIDNVVNHGKQFIMGYEYDDNNNIVPLIEDFGSLRTLGISGVSRSGKTNTETFILSQAILLGMQCYVCDSNYRKASSLTNAIEAFETKQLVTIARTTEDIEHSCLSFFHELHNRVSGESTDTTEKLLLIDEYTAIATNKKLIKLLQPGLLDIATQGSGYGMYLIVGAQSFRASVSGGSILVDSLQSAMVHRTTTQESSILLPGIYGKDAPELKTGQCILKTSNADFHTVYIPLMSSRDCEDIAAMVSGMTYKPSGLYSKQWSNETTLKLIPDLNPNPYRRN